MKKSLLLLLLVLLPIAYSQEVKIDYFVNDYANLLTFEQKADIEPILKEIYDSKKAEYAIVIINSLNGEDIEGYSYKLAEGNLGDKEKNNGLLLLIAVDDRKYRFEVGRGLEPIMPDIITGRIGRDYLTPNFRNGDYATGIKEASLAVKAVLFNNTESGYYVNNEISQIDLDAIFTVSTIIFIIIVIFFVIIIVSIIKAAKNGVGKKRNPEDYFFAGWILGELMKGGKGGSGGGFSGGGGGFGGGSFGGGGSSGGW